MLQVLLIDDNPAQLQVRQAVLQQAGFSVSTAMTAEALFLTGLAGLAIARPVC